MKNQNLYVFDRCYNDIKSDLSIYSCNLITNLENAVLDFNNISLLKNEKNRYSINFIKDKIDVLKRNITKNKHSILQDEFYYILECQNKIKEKERMKIYLETKDFNLINYELIKIYSCLNFDLNFEGFSPSCIKYVFDSVCSDVISGNFVDKYNCELIKGL